MRLDTILLTVGVMATVNAAGVPPRRRSPGPITSATAAVSVEVEFWQAAGKVATVDASIQLIITASEKSDNEFDFKVVQGKVSASEQTRLASPENPPKDVSRSVSGDMGLLPAIAGPSKNQGQAHIKFDPIAINDNTNTPGIRINIDWHADVEFMAAPSSTTGAKPAGPAMFRLSNVKFSGAVLDFVEPGTLSAHIIKAGGRIIASK